MRGGECHAKKYVDSLDGRLSSQSLLIPRRSRTLVWGFEPPPFFPIQSRPPDWLVAARLPRCTPSATCWVRVARVLGAFASRSRRSVRHLCTHHVNQNGCSHHVRGCRPRRCPPRLRRPPVRARRRPRSPRAGPRGASEKSLDGARRTVAHAARVAPGPVARRSRRGRVARTRVPRSPRDPGSLARSSPRVRDRVSAPRASGLGLRRAARARHPSEIAGGALAIHSLRPRSRASDIAPPLTSPRPPAIPPSLPRSSTRAVQAAKPSLSARVCVPARPPPSRPPLPPSLSSRARQQHPAAPSPHFHSPRP